MNRSRFLAAVLALGGLLGAAEVRSASNEHQARLRAFEQKAQKERQAQGLENNRAALFAKYPSPEMKLAGNPDAELIAIPVKSEATVSLTGHFVPGSLSETECSGAEVITEKVTETQLDARVRVSAEGLPGPCILRVFSPVSLATASQRAFRVVGNHQWQLALANGMKVKMSTTAVAAKPDITGTSEWFDKSGKSLGTRAVTLDPHAEGFGVTVQRTQEEKAASAQVAQSARQDSSRADIQKQSAEIQQKMQAECMKLPGAQMGPCIKKYTEQLKALSQGAQNKAQATQQKMASTAVGCDTLSLQASAGKVSGKGNTCGAPGEVAVTGTVTAK